MATRTDTDDFNRANASPVSGNWVTFTNACQIVSNKVRSVAVGGGGSEMRWTLPFPANQISNIKVATMGGGGGQIRSVARASSSATTYYTTVIGNLGTSTPVIFKFVAGAFNDLGGTSNGTVSIGSTISCDCQGTTIRALLDGVQKHSVTDSAIISGYPGMGCLASSAVADVEIDDWSAEGVGYPVVLGNSCTDGTTASATPIIDLYTSGRTDTIKVVMFRSADAGAVGWPAGWNELVDGSPDASTDQTSIAWKASEGSDAATITLSAATQKFASSAWEIYYVNQSQAPELSTVATGTSTSPNPTAVTPSGGSKDYLILWLGSWEGEQTYPPAGVPTNYSEPVAGSSGTGGAVTTNCQVAGAWRHVTGTTEDPPAWTISVSDDWNAYALAVYPYVVSADVTASISGVTASTAVGTLTASGGDVGEGRTSIATDNFNRSNENPITGNWTDLNPTSSSIQILSNAFQATVNAFASARWTGAGTFTDDQYSSVVLAPQTTSSTIGVIVRASGDLNSTRDHYGYYMNDHATKETELMKTVNGTITSLNSTTSVTWATTNRIEIECEGTTIRGLKNQIEQISVTDSSLTTGKPGIMGYYIGGTSQQGDDWDGGNISEAEVTFKVAWARNCNQLIGVGAR